MNEVRKRRRARDLGLGLLAVLGLAGLLFWVGHREGWWAERYLVLATVRDARKLAVGSPVYFRGLYIGKVVMIRPPAPDLPGYKLRMAVDKAAFRHLPLDAPVRIDPGRGDLPYQVTILPGREPLDWFFPGQVKVLREVTPQEDGVRMFRDVLDGLVDLSKAKATEAEMLELREEVKRLT